MATTSAPLDLASAWGGTGHVTDLGGPVHWVDFGGPDDEGPPLVLVHGLGGSHLNWVLVAPAFTDRHHVYALDQAGFGLTPGAGRDTSVQANATLVARFLREVVGRPAVLVGNSMGGMVSSLVAADHPDLVAGLVLIDPSIPVPRKVPDPRVAMTFALYATPVVGERYMALMTARTPDRKRVQGVVDLCFADPSRADAAVIDAGVVLAAYRRQIPGQERAFLGAARSLMRMLGYPPRYRAVLAGITAPVLLLHGEADRLVDIAAARVVAADHPHWETEFYPGVGHTPQLEVPDLVIARIGRWLGDHDLGGPPPDRRRREADVTS